MWRACKALFDLCFTFGRTTSYKRQLSLCFDLCIGSRFQSCGNKSTGKVKNKNLETNMKQIQTTSEADTQRSRDMQSNNTHYTILQLASVGGITRKAMVRNNQLTTTKLAFVMGGRHRPCTGSQTSSEEQGGQARGENDNFGRCKVDMVKKEMDRIEKHATLRIASVVLMTVVQIGNLTQQKTSEHMRLSSCT